MGNCNVHCYFLQVIDVESLDTRLAGRSDLIHEENYENNCFFSKLCGHYLPVVSEKQYFFLRHCAGIAGFGLLQSAYKSSSAILCQAQFYLVVSMFPALLHAINTMKSTIDDEDYIIDWTVLIVIIQ